MNQKYKFTGMRSGGKVYERCLEVLRCCDQELHIEDIIDRAKVERNHSLPNNLRYDFKRTPGVRKVKVNVYIFEHGEENNASIEAPSEHVPQYGDPEIRITRSYRRYQRQLKRKLSKIIDVRCEFTGVTDINVLELIHIDDIGEKGPDIPENATFADPSFHSMYDDGTILINPETRIIEFTREIDPVYKNMLKTHEVKWPNVEKVYLQRKYDRMKSKKELKV